MIWLLALLAGGAFVLSRPQETTPSFNLPGKQQVRDRLAAWAAHRGIPPTVLYAWAALESNFNVREYNPEKTAMLKWACEIAGKPEKWGRNPDYAQAQKVCQLLDSKAATPTDIVNQGIWTFGSWGLLQVSRISAAETGRYPYHLPNRGLLDLETNLDAGTAEILNKLKGLYPGRSPGSLNLQEWSLVRAAYVMGVAGVLSGKYPDRVKLRQEKFLAAISKIQEVA